MVNEYCQILEVFRLDPEPDPTIFLKTGSGSDYIFEDRIWIGPLSGLDLTKTGSAPLVKTLAMSCEILIFVLLGNSLVKSDGWDYAFIGIRCLNR